MGAQKQASHVKPDVEKADHAIMQELFFAAERKGETKGGTNI